MGHLHLGKFPVPAFPFFDVLVETAHCQSARTSWQDDQPYAFATLQTARGRALDRARFQRHRRDRRDNILTVGDRRLAWPE